MKTNCLVLLCCVLLLFSKGLNAQATASFSTPDTVCVNAPINITNTSTGATSYFWNFCVANVNTGPFATNLGTLGGVFSQPVFMDFVEVNGNYYGFVVNHNPGGLVRLDFGNSLLNTPVAVSLGNPSGAMNSNWGNEGIQVVKANGEWFVLIVGGNPASSTTPRLVTVKFGANITNPSPIGVNWGNIGNMLEPMDLHVFESNGTWYGFTVNSVNNTITRFNFSNNLNNAPTGVNLGNIGGLSYPDGIYVLNDNGTWRGFITNGSTSTITRLDFGTSLLNTPLGVNLGTVGGALSQPRDLTIINYCGQAVGFAVNGGNNTITRLNFSSLTSTPTSTNLGNLGGLNFPHSLSKLFRVGNDLYSFITNANNNTLTRLRFSGCTNSSIPNSTLQNPPTISYNTPGTYNVNLSVDDGLTTQSAFCKQIVVVAPPAITPQLDTSICPGGSANLHPIVTGATTYSWTPSTGLSNPNIANPVASPTVTTQYILTATNGGGCSISDTVVVTVLSQQTCNPVIVTPGFTAPDTVCVNAPINITNTSSGATNYFWNFCVANVNSTPVATNLGTLGGVFSQPVFMDFVEDNGNYYGFVVNHNPGGLVRLDFGNSLLNTPVAVSLGNPSGAMNSNWGNEGIQVVKANGEWFVLIVGGNPASSTTPRLVTVKFGANITNPSPIGVNWGNIGNMLEPMDLHVFESNGTWYGFTVNSVNNTITRFNFSNNLNNAPTGVNLGNIGGLSYPDGIYVLNDNGTWRGFITNGSTSTITRLDFGTSLLNTPVGVNLGTVGGVLSQPRDLTIINYCGQAVGFAVNGGNNTITRLNFSSLTSTPTSTNLGNLGGLNFPHSLSKLFRVGNDLFSFITNANNNTLTRLRFSGCTNSSIPNSTLQNPPTISYNTPGTYNINLSVDDGLTTQSAYCKQIVVVAPPVITPQLDTSICPGGSANLHPIVTGATTYSWTPSTGLSDPNIANPVATPSVTTQYILTATNVTGCSKSDTVIVNVLTPQQCGQIIVTPGFTAPDTVCVGSQVTVNNTTSNASSYYWSFCAADLNAIPTGASLGNPGGQLTTPCFMDYVNVNGNYYGFITSNNPASLVRLDFGNSLLNAPTATNLGNFGNIIPLGAQGIQVVYESGSWFAFITGGDIAASPTATPRIVKVDFGANITNASPIVTNWGNIGAMAYPVDLYMFKNAGTWYGFTVNYQNATITRFNFGSNFNSPPTGVNLGNLGGLNQPNGLFPINDNGTWRLFISNFGNNTITRLDFGNSLLNAPSSSINLGTLGGTLHNPRDLNIFNNCGQYVGYLVNESTNDFVRLNFNNLAATPTATSIGNIGGISSPHSISKIFRVGPDLFAFVPNSYINTVSRIRFTGCTNSSIPNSTSQNPPTVTYNTPGIYNINLTVDDGLPTQAAFCKQVVVIGSPAIIPQQDTSICPGGAAGLHPVITGATSFSWSPTTGLSNPNIANPIATPSITTQYILTATNATGCSASDTVEVNVLTPQQCSQIIVTPGFTAPDTVCVGNSVNITNTSINASSYYWNFCASDLTAAPTGVSLGNPGNFLTTPCFTDYVLDNGNYYGFVTSANPASLVRLDFGNSLLNTPTATNLGNFGNLIPLGAQGIQIINEGGVWYVFIVGGDIIADPVATPRIVKLNFGASLSNPAPVVTNWGNIGAMAYPHDLYMIKNAGIWYGFTVNYGNSTITRFTFGPNFNSPPVGINFGNLGALNKPTGLFMTNDNGTWRMFVANYNNHTISRIDFGNTIVNLPTGSANLGNPGNFLNNARDLHIFNNCGQYTGFSINDNTNEIVKLNFSSLTNVPGAVSLGTSTGINTPHSISKVFTEGVDLYAFVVNAYANTISRIKFSGCSSSSMPGSSLQNPPAYTYNAPGTYNINLTVDNGMLSQSAFCKKVVVMPTLTHSPTLSIGLCNTASVKIGSSIKPATYLWNNGLTSDSIVVTTSGTYWVESSRYGCTVRDSFIVNISNNAGIDFAYQQDMCSPKTIQFTTGLFNPLTFNWNFGNSQSNNNSLQPVITYANYGSYTVKLVAQMPGGCMDSVEKIILVDNVFDNNLVNNIDTTICLGDSILLRTNGLISNYCWNASTGLTPTSLNAYVKPIVPTTYTLTSQVLGNNLIANPDFSGGNTGFTSDYNYVSPNVTEGQYWVATNPVSWNGAMSSCGDHTSGTGNMMIVNGSPIGGSKVWTQTITVVPNTNYQFSTWLTSVSSPNPANLQFSINNNNLGNSINASATTCQWNQFSTIWNSGNNTSAVITIVNNNTIASGNDFALDDIFFGTVITKTDSFTVNMTGLCDSIKLTGPDKICSPTDTLTYSIYKSANCTQQFSLVVDNTFADIISQTPTSVKLVFKKNGSTSIKVSFNNSCKIVVDSLAVTVKFSPTNINFGPDISGCRDTTLLLNAGAGFVSYQWQNGSPDSTFTASAPGTYYVLAQNLCGAQFKDTLKIIKYVTNPFSVSPLNATVCAGDSVLFTASGGTGYQWQPAVSFNNPTGAVTKAIINVSQNYTCQITDANCGRDTLVIIPVVASSSANISATKSNDVSCSTDTAVLKASGGISYSWSPNQNIIRNGNGQITVNPTQNTMYYVAGTNSLGCKGIDSVLVSFINSGDQQLFMPNAFSPNGDGLNDVFRPKFVGPAKKYQFSVFNRWGQLIFRSTTPGQGWDGKYQSKDQPSDVFVYYVTAEGGCNGKFETKGTFVLIR